MTNDQLGKLADRFEKLEEATRKAYDAASGLAIMTQARARLTPGGDDAIEAEVAINNLLGDVRRAIKEIMLLRPGVLKTRPKRQKPKRKGAVGNV